MLSPEQIWQLIICANVGVTAVVWIAIVTTLRWLEERKSKKETVLSDYSY